MADLLAGLQVDAQLHKAERALIQVPYLLEARVPFQGLHEILARHSTSLPTLTKAKASRTGPLADSQELVDLEKKTPDPIPAQRVARLRVGKSTFACHGEA